MEQSVKPYRTGEKSKLSRKTKTGWSGIGTRDESTLMKKEDATASSKIVGRDPTEESVVIKRSHTKKIDCQRVEGTCKADERLQTTRQGTRSTTTRRRLLKRMQQVFESANFSKTVIRERPTRMIHQGEERRVMGVVYFTGISLIGRKTSPT